MGDGWRVRRDFHPLAVRDTRVEIGGLAKTVVFDVPRHLARTFAWRAGQHVSLRFLIDGEEARRSYSVSSSPASGDPLQITVKRVKDGLVSNHVNDTVEAGAIIEVMPPFGGFRLDPGGTLRRTHYLFGAGSGITPIHAMLRSVLEAEPWSAAHLLYGNRNADSILFRERLSEYAGGHPGRLTVRHVLSRASARSGFDHWRRGIIDGAAVEALIAEEPPYAQDAQYYICGPGGMNRAVEAALRGMDVPPERIHLESYGGGEARDDGVEGVAARAAVTLGGRTRTVAVARAQTVLEAVRAAGWEPPYSCQSGVCGACRARLAGGSVHMRARMALDDAEIEAGAVLTCQSVATSAVVALSYD